MNEADPRVQRTRKLLHQALRELLQEKSFHSIRVQDLAERATLNRATFYAHFPDKYALLDDLVGEWFRAELRRPGLVRRPLDGAGLTALVGTVLEFVRAFHGGCRPSDRDLEPMLETRMQAELADVLQEWMDPGAARASPAARLMSWAIFGSAIDWARAPGPEDLETRVREIVGFLSRGLDALAAPPTAPTAR